MKSYIVMFVLMVCTFFSCNKDEESGSLAGRWSMINATGGIAGFNQNYPKGQILWTFEGGVLGIENKYTGQLNFSYPTGTYRYLELNPSNIRTLYINDQEFGNIEISHDSLIIDQASFIADGFRYLYFRD